MGVLDNINKLLIKNDITGSKMCGDIGLSSGVYSQWMSGHSSPSKRTLLKIAEYFGVTYDNLISGNLEKEKTPTQGEGLTGLDQELIRTILSLSESEKASLYAFLSTHKRDV